MVVLSVNYISKETSIVTVYLFTGSSQQAYMTRSKTNVTTGGQAKQGGGGRSLTAMPSKKDANLR